MSTIQSHEDLDPRSSQSKLIVLVAVTVLTLMLAVFALSLDNYFVSDDWIFLHQVMTRSDLASIWRFAFDVDMAWFLRPNQWLITWFLFSLAGVRPWAFHLTSILLHFVNGVLAVAVYYRLLSKRTENPRRALLFAGLAGLLFLVNWHHHEALFWYSAINEPLAGFFQLLSLLMVLLAVSQTTHRAFYWVVALLAFVLSLLTKESAASLSLVLITLLLVDLVLRIRQDSQVDLPKLLKQRLPVLTFFLVLGIWLAVYFSRSSPYSANLIADQNRFLIAIGLVRYFLGHYIDAHALLPWSHTFTLYVGGMVLLSALGALLRRRYILVWSVFWMLVGSTPYLLFTPFPSDRFLYLTAVPASILIVETARWIKQELSWLVRIPVRLAGTVILSSVIGIYLSYHLLTLGSLEREWDAAGDIGRNIIAHVQSVASNPNPQTTLCLDNLPDSFNSKYVFRNGSVEALYIAYGRANFDVRSVVQPMSDAYPTQTLVQEGCDYIFYYDDETNTLVTQTQP